MSDAFDRLKQRPRTSVPARDSSLLKMSEAPTSPQVSPPELATLCQQSGLSEQLLVSAALELVLTQPDLRQEWLARARQLHRHGPVNSLWLELAGSPDWIAQVLAAAEDRGQVLSDIAAEALASYLDLSRDRPTLREEVDSLRREIELMKRKLTGW
jgi:hypothetical protein